MRPRRVANEFQRRAKIPTAVIIKAIALTWVIPKSLPKVFSLSTNPFPIARNESGNGPMFVF